MLALFRCLSCKFSFSPSLAELDKMGSPGRVFQTGQVSLVKPSALHIAPFPPIRVISQTCPIPTYHTNPMTVIYIAHSGQGVGKGPPFPPFNPLFLSPSHSMRTEKMKSAPTRAAR